MVGARVRMVDARSRTARARHDAIRTSGGAHADRIGYDLTATPKLSTIVLVVVPVSEKG